MVGVRKLAIAAEDLATTIFELLKTYYTVEIQTNGSPKHEKAGLSKDKVLVLAYGRRQ